MRARIERMLAPPRAIVALGLSLVVTCAAPGVAGADPRVEQGVRHFADADLEAALASFAEAEASDDLTRADLVELLEVRSLVQFALGNPSAVERDVRALAIVDPAHHFRGDAPPEVVAMFERVRTETATPLTLEVTLDAHSGDPRVVAHASGIGEALVRELSLSCVLDGERHATTHGTAPAIAIGDARQARCGARAVGPGGATIATIAPRVFRGSAERGGGVPWLAIGVTAAAVAVVGAVIAVVLVASTSTSGVQPTAPMVVF